MPHSPCLMLQAVDLLIRPRLFRTRDVVGDCPNSVLEEENAALLAKLRGAVRALSEVKAAAAASAKPLHTAGAANASDAGTRMRRRSLPDAGEEQPQEAEEEEEGREEGVGQEDMPAGSMDASGPQAAQEQQEHEAGVREEEAAAPTLDYLLPSPPEEERGPPPVAPPPPVPHGLSSSSDDSSSGDALSPQDENREAGGQRAAGRPVNARLPLQPASLPDSNTQQPAGAWMGNGEEPHWSHHHANKRS